MSALGFVALTMTLSPTGSMLAIEHAKLYLLRDKYAACAGEAISYAPKKAFKVCSFQMADELYSVIVFDSGDELALPEQSRSPQWRDFIQGPRSGIGLFECRSDGQYPLGDHFYFLRFICD